MARKKIISLALAALLTASTTWQNPSTYQSVIKAGTSKAIEKTEEDVREVVSEAEEVDAGDYGLCDDIQDGTILHCFDWKYSDIKAELPNIAAAGFTSVQTSPAQKGDGQIWYWLYQPQTFSIQPNALGNKDELASAISSVYKLCDKAVSKGILHKNTAARKKSRLVLAIKKLEK